MWLTYEPAGLNKSRPARMRAGDLPVLTSVVSLNARPQFPGSKCMKIALGLPALSGITLNRGNPKMPNDKERRALCDMEKDKPALYEIRNERDARAAFAAFLDDEQELKAAAANFVKLGGRLAGSAAGREERYQFYQRLYDRIVRDPATDRERPPDEKASELRRTLEEMREQDLTLRSSPTARRAHLEIDIYNPATDDLRETFTVPEGRTRAEHAGLLNRTNREARDLFERGATVHGETLIIPRLGAGAPGHHEQIHTGSLAHAIREFAPLVGEAEAKIKAAEFVRLGTEIAGLTADGDTRLVLIIPYSTPETSNLSLLTISIRQRPISAGSLYITFLNYARDYHPPNAIICSRSLTAQNRRSSLARR